MIKIHADAGWVMSKKKLEPQRIPRIGDLFLEYEYVTKDQLGIALKHLDQTGGRLGSILLELGYVSTEELLAILEKKFGLPTANLEKLTIQPHVLKMIPYEQVIKHKVIPIAIGTKNIFMAMVEPNDPAALADLEFALGKTIQPIVVPYAQMEKLLQYIEGNGGVLDHPVSGMEILGRGTSAEMGERRSSLMGYLEMLVQEHASDLLLTAGVPPSFKINNEICRIADQRLTPQDVAAFVDELLTAPLKELLAADGDIDLGKTIPELGRFRVNIFKQRDSYSIVVRSMLEELPTLERLGLADGLADYALRNQGLILVTGPAGHGKSTTLAALIDTINTHRKCNIITVEDPIEFHHKHKLSNVNQREVGRDTPSFHQGLHSIFRQAPDVIVIGEMRDPETIAIALHAAETGHLVISTLNANFSTTALERMVDIFPVGQQQQIRVQLAENFLLILNQRLIQKKDGTGRVLAYEKLINSPRIKNMIREGKFHQFRSLYKQSSDEFQSIDASLAKLVNEHVISFEAGSMFCENVQYFTELISKGRGAL